MMWWRSRSQVGWLVCTFIFRRETALLLFQPNTPSVFKPTLHICIIPTSSIWCLNTQKSSFTKTNPTFLTLPSDQNWKEEDNSSLYKTGETFHSEIVGKVWNNYSPREREGVFYREVLCASFFWHGSIKLLNSKLLKFLSKGGSYALLHSLKRSIMSQHLMLVWQNYGLTIFMIL